MSESTDSDSSLDAAFARALDNDAVAGAVEAAFTPRPVPTLPLDAEFDLAVASDAGDDSEHVESDDLPTLSMDAEFDIAVAGEEDTDAEEESTDSLPRDVEFDIAVLSDDSEAVGDGSDLPRNPAFEAELAERIANGRPLIEHLDNQPRLRKLDFAFGPIYAPAGFRTVVTITPQCRYRGEKLMATDSATPSGTGTFITNVTVGQKLQRPDSQGRGSLTQFFAQNALANGIRFDTANAWENISLSIHFVRACTFYANLFGSAVIE